MELHVGCAMWTHAAWQGRYLPHSLSPRDRLRAYAAWCNAVEGNTTFYAVPSLGAVKSWEQQLERTLGDVGAEWVTLDTSVLFESPPVTDAEREAWVKKPRLPRRSRALTSHPIVRYIGRDDAARTIAGWQHWLDAVTGWLREGRSPTFFIHTPDNVDALELARRFHDDVRARLPEVEPLPEPVPPEPPTLF
jgi:uncharacterized protein YecE (DUF72 family)